MDDIPRQKDATAAEWEAILAESEAELAAGQIVSGDEVMRELHESIARMEGKKSARRVGAARGTTRRR
jgi:RNA polymerase-interacting CarD/CdnL/TRCF family regulator